MRKLIMIHTLVVLSGCSTQFDYSETRGLSYETSYVAPCIEVTEGNCDTEEDIKIPCVMTHLYWEQAQIIRNELSGNQQNDFYMSRLNEAKALEAKAEADCKDKDN